MSGDTTLDAARGYCLEENQDTAWEVAGGYCLEDSQDTHWEKQLEIQAWDADNAWLW